MAKEESVDQTAEAAPQIDGQNAQIERIENEPTESQRLLDAADQNGRPRVNPAADHQEAPSPPGPTLCEKPDTNLLTTAFGSVTTVKSSDKTNSINCRTVLWYITFFGFVINYMYRININIAIVGMVATRKSASHNVVQAACVITPILNDTLNSTATTTDSSLYIQETVADPTKFDWNEIDQGKVLGAFYVAHWLLQIPSGILAQRYGTKLVFGLSNFVSCTLSFAVPYLAHMGVNWLMSVRILQGLISSMCWPAMHHLAAQWIPPSERSKFLAAYLGGSLCIAVFYPFFGFIMTVWSWEWVFHITGCFGVVWYAAWLYYVYDTPAQHPRIDPMERLYIENSLEGVVHESSGKRRVPWLQIWTSKAMWINIIGQFGGMWGYVTIMTQLPTYFTNVFGWGPQMTGILTGVPQGLRMIFAYLLSVLIDHILQNNLMSRDNVRKIAGGLSSAGTGILVLVAAYAGCNSTIALTFLALANMVHGSVSSGPLASLIDMSPNFSGITMGIASFVILWPGVMSAYVVGKITLGDQSVQQWQYVFLITASVPILCGVIYILFADSSLQSWNSVKTDDCEQATDEKSSRAVRVPATPSTKNNREKQMPTTD